MEPSNSPVVKDSWSTLRWAVSCLRPVVQKEFCLVKYFILKVTVDRIAIHVLFDASKGRLKMH